MNRSVGLTLVGCMALGFGCAAEEAGPADPAAPEYFLAQQRDFEDFRDWMAFPLEGPAAHPQTTGQTTVYINRLPGSGTQHFAVGTMIVKTNEDPSSGELTIHAMVKRGGEYNADGALGWEFFELVINADDVPVLVWRGAVPPDGEGYTLQPGTGSDADAGVEAPCNGCHTSDVNDAVLDDALDLQQL